MSSVFGTRLKEFREARGWSQERVGFELELTKATISKWETGRSEPSLGNLAKIRRLFALDGLTLDYLIDETVSPGPHRSTARYVSESGVERDSARIARSQDEAALLIRYRALSPARRRNLLHLIGD